ncbi:MAG: hypothetical protein LBS09_07765 [Bacteroidales bacterium]|jgi:hypothetical protein|nr:hypothetical protein [Bacteroidales bacterium]
MAHPSSELESSHWLSYESSLKEILSKFESASKQQQELFDTHSVVVMDAGIATEAVMTGDICVISCHRKLW